MTRINLIDPFYLCDRHLMAEYREIRHIPASLNRSLKSKGYNKSNNPTQFSLNTGHVKFFYDKGCYIHIRWLQLKEELLRRGYNLNTEISIDCSVFENIGAYNNWSPAINDIKIVADRINQRINEKPDLYKDKQRFLDYYESLALCV